MRNSRFLLLPVVLGVVCVLAVHGFAKPKPSPVLEMSWPNPDHPTLKLAFTKFQELASYKGENSISAEVTVQNVSDKPMARASFTVYFFDKDHVRIGETILSIRDLGPGQAAKYPLQFFSVGIPNTLQLQARNDPAGVPSAMKTVSLKVITVPPGASFKVDGQDAGVTPKMIYLVVGTHNLEFTKEGYASGKTPVEITADELPGGSITVELGGLARDTVELRDGTVLLGDVISMSLTEVALRVNGETQTIDRNRVKKMLLVERVVQEQTTTTQ